MYNLYFYNWNVIVKMKPEPAIPDAPPWEMVCADDVRQEQMNRIEQLVKQTLQMEASGLLDDLSINTRFQGLKITLRREPTTWKQAADTIYSSISNSLRGTKTSL